MSTGHELTFAVEFGKRRRQSDNHRMEPLATIPRISRLMALAIRMAELVRTGEVRDYAELARLGGVTRARMSQIMHLLDLAPDIQEQLLFLNEGGKLTERTLREIVRQVDWQRQREVFRRLANRAANLA
jgi:hypothetical protein